MVQQKKKLMTLSAAEPHETHSKNFNKLEPGRKH